MAWWNPATWGNRTVPANNQSRTMLAQWGAQHGHLPGVNGVVWGAPGTPNGGWRASAAASEALRLVATNAASLHIDVLNGQGKPVRHPFADLYNIDPGNGTSAAYTRLVVWWRLATRGECGIVLNRNTRGVPTSMHPVFTDIKVDWTVPTREHPVGVPAQYRVRDADNTEHTYSPAEFMWLRFPDPDNPYTYRSPVAAALLSLGMANAAREWQAGEFANGASAKAIVYAGPFETEDDFLAFRGDLQSQTTGPRAAGSLVAINGETPPEVAHLSLTPQEMSFIDSLKVTNEDIVMALGVPNDLVFGKSTYANQRDAKVRLWSDRIKPDLRVVESEFDRVMTPGAAVSTVFDLSSVEALQTDRSAAWERVRLGTLAGSPWTVDELRNEVGLPPVKFGNLPPRVFEAALLADLGLVSDPGGAADRSTGQDGQADRAARAVDPGEPVSTRASETTPDELVDATLKAITSGLGIVVEKWRQDALNRAAREIAKGRPLTPAILAADGWEATVRDLLGPILVAAARDAYTTTGTNLTGVTLDGVDRVEDAARDRAGFVAGTVVSTTVDSFVSRLAGMGDGDDPVGLVQGLFDGFLDRDDENGNPVVGRTSLVGELESHVAVETGRAAAVDDTDTVPGVTIRGRWITRGDDRVRDSHKRLHRETVGKGERFGNGCRYPHDPDGPADETINCRCKIEYYDAG